MLILAAISIATLTGENGVLTKARDAKDLSKTAEEKEQIGLAYNAVLAEKMKNGDKTAVIATELEAELKKLNLDVTLKENSQPIEVTFNKTGNKYKVDGTNGKIDEDGNSGGGSTPELTLPQTSETKPYLLDSNSKVLSNDIDEGIVVRDSKQNEWVWIEVPRTATVYQVAGLEITAFTDEEYTKIENDLKTYTNDYRNGTAYKDEWKEKEQHGFKDANDYNNHKKSMLKSVYQNGGFYIGRYEVGATTHVSSDDNGARTPIIKQDAFPYNYVTCKKAQELSTGLATTEGRTSSLMFGVQWDLVLKYIEERGTKLGTTKDERKSKMIKTTYDLVSSDWGNYSNIGFTITRGEYSTDNGLTYKAVNQEEGYEKPKSGVILTTGATERNSVLNIYDLAGNEWEWTLEYTAITGYPCAPHGGSYYNDASGYPASRRGADPASTSYYLISFRPALW